MKVVAAFSVIFMNILYSYVRDGCQIGIAYNGRREATKIAQIIAFIFFLCVHVCFSLGFLIKYVCKQLHSCQEENYNWICFYVIEAGAGTLYYVGNNLVSVVTEFTEETNSTIPEDPRNVDPRLRKALVASDVILLFAGFLYLIPLVKDTAKGLKGLNKDENKHKEISKEASGKDAQSYCCSEFIIYQLPLLSMIQHLPKTDTLFSVTTMSGKFTDYDCKIFQNSAYYHGATWAMWGLLMVTLFITLSVLVLRYTSSNMKYCAKVLVVQIILSLLISVLFGAYILADNPFPLRCRPSERAEVGIRLVLWVFSFALTLTAAIFLAMYWEDYNQAQENIVTIEHEEIKMSPRQPKPAWPPSELAPVSP